MLICSLGFIILKNSVQTDTKNMMLYQAVYIEQNYPEVNLNPLPQGNLIKAFTNPESQASYIQNGFNWQEMQLNTLYEESLKNKQGERVYVYALKYQPKTPEASPLYIVSEYQKSIEDQIHYDESLIYKNISSIAIAGAVVIFSTLFLFFVCYYMLLSPVRAVSEWLAKPTKTIPYHKLKYRELTEVVSGYKRYIDKRNELMEKEELFLSTMSHELRTPISIISSSVELLDRLEVEPKVTRVNQRISYAIRNMDYLVKTLLWLSRKNNQPLTQSAINLSTVIKAVVKDNEYLLAGKESQLMIETHLDAEFELNDNYGAVYLILVNLIRNALQYSGEGTIIIRQEKGSVTIQNPKESDDSNNGAESYGYGLYLVEKICRSRAYRFSNSYEQDAIASVCFSPSQ